MALIDLSLVTQALIRLIREQVSTSTNWQPRPEPSVSPLPPDQLAGGGLGCYLYHLSEEAQHKNLPAPPGNTPPVRYTPLALNLYYQLTAHSATDTPEGHYEAQLLFGLAVKTLHDYPILTDATRVNGVAILEAVGLAEADNRIRLALQPLPHNEAVSFWTAGSSPLRLSTYYQAGVVLLEPEPPPARAGRVLSYGVYPFVSGAPRLTGSENSLRFPLPESTEVQEIRLRPAEVSVGGRLDLTGFDLAGDETRLWLQNRRWTEAHEADAAWGVNATSSRISAVVQETIGGEAALPGVYSAKIQVVRHRPAPEGGARRFEHSSNETPFTIAPRIDAVGAPNGEGVLEVTGYLFQHPELDAEELRIYLGTLGLQRNTGDVFERGQFLVDSSAALRLRLPEGLAPGKPVPLRIVVNGAESSPRWVTVP